jgi:hypothetical protein
MFCCFGSVFGSNVLQGYGEGENDYVTFGLSAWCGQSFTANSSYVLTDVGLRLFHFSGVASDVVVSLRGTDGAGLPVGSDLATGYLAGSGLGLDLAGSWFNVSLGNFSMMSGARYALVVHTVDVLDVGGWLVDSGSQGFLGGNCLGSVDNGTTWSNDFGRDCMFMVYGEESEASSSVESMSVVLNQPSNASMIGTFNCDFSFTPTVFGVDSFRNASLFIDGVPVAGNSSVLVNATVNVISYAFSGNGSFLWSVQVWNSSCGVFASENFSLTVGVYVADFCPVNLLIASPLANATVEEATVCLEASTNGSGLRVWYRILNGSSVVKGNTTYTENVVLADLQNGEYRLEAFANNSEGFSASEIVMFNIELPARASNGFLVVVVVVVMVVVVTFICVFLVARLRRTENSAS